MKVVMPECPARGGKPLQAEVPIPLFPKEPEEGGTENCLKVKIKFQPGNKKSQDCGPQQKNKNTTPQNSSGEMTSTMMQTGKALDQQ